MADVAEARARASAVRAGRPGDPRGGVRAALRGGLCADVDGRRRGPAPASPSRPSTCATRARPTSSTAAVAASRSASCPPETGDAARRPDRAPAPPAARHRAVGRARPGRQRARRGAAHARAAGAVPRAHPGAAPRGAARHPRAGPRTRRRRRAARTSTPPCTCCWAPTTPSICRGEPFALRWPEAEVDLVLAGLGAARQSAAGRECPAACIGGARRTRARRRACAARRAAVYLMTAIVSPARDRRRPRSRSAPRPCRRGGR